MHCQKSRVLWGAATPGSGKEISTFLIFLTNKIEPAQLSDFNRDQSGKSVHNICLKSSENCPGLPQKESCMKIPNCVLGL
jgi:hypothetical protein